MTDKPPQSLNLIERMAQRMAKQDVSVVEDAPPQLRRQPVEAPPVDQARIVARAVPNTAETRDHSVLPSEQRSEPVRTPIAGDKSRHVRLDFRVMRQNGMITPDNMTSVISNQFRAIKRKLLQKVRDPDTRAPVKNLVMVTSSLPGEGKTFTSINLAISLAAERGMQVLLMDADVIRPAVGNVFKDTPREGLTDLLSGKSTVSDVMCRCEEIPNLAVIFAGRARADSPELISSSRMFDLCNDLSTRYPDRIIVIDTPPVLASPEPATLAGYVHQLIMVVAANQTDRHQLRAALESVASCKNVNLLFNKAPRWDETEYRSYYGYANTAASVPDSASTPVSA
jgi:protein-tyrosine kinase